ncbi:hypothetical protein [Nonomuraea wenchangensis]|uniref:Uncharacterized protein n=1 Tax=Nonomuraea wenchangensis TaxID=568860 RepID=A0A1I0LUA7_9ACTN|nr:hypothetical protein [Nonomuraea wenchangensis]SEU46658.1 hypothetical protein SAMN05421811_127109 [Nonomuraea wenchangensis]
MSIVKKTPTVWGQEPAVIAYVLNALLAFLVTIPALGLDETAAGYISTIGSGVLALIVAWQTRPWVISALTGSVSTILTGVSHFWLVLTPAQTAAFILLLSSVLGLVLRGHVSPKAGPVAPVVVVNRLS